MEGDRIDHPEDVDIELALDLLEVQLSEGQLDCPRARWLARRRLGIGCSDLPAMWLALGLATYDERVRAKEYIHNHADYFHSAKVGHERAPKVGSAARRGRKQEVDLFRTWKQRLTDKRFVHEVEKEIDARTFIHVEGHPTLQRILPIVDRHEPRLIDSTDALALTTDKKLVVVQGKCTGDLVGTDCPWYWTLQVQGEIAVTDADFGVVVCGEGWASGFEPAPDSFRVWAIPRDQHRIAEIRSAVRDSWARVDALRSAARDRVAATPD